MRELKKLVRPDEAEVAESTIETAGQQKKSRVNGAIMALGIGLAMICGIAGAFVYSTASKLIPDISIEEALAIEAEGIRKASVNELFAVWENYYKDRHMAEWQESVIRSEMVQGNLLRKVSYVLFAVSALSLLAFIASLAGLGARKTAA